MERIKFWLDQIGLEPERVRMFNMSAAMASEFVAATEQMTEQISSLGPSPLRPSPPPQEEEPDGC